ncbi:unnamed protein product [Pleuronectes platessa]|uniref:Uncharacterized protein n=1 Tax=Pleuronectes platessa TaxID=8262 RepID=A0A9N7VVR8_PLEPL|nr:unnamed protein product [Pleuronectes platessa]
MPLKLLPGLYSGVFRHPENRGPDFTADVFHTCTTQREVYCVHTGDKSSALSRREVEQPAAAGRDRKATGSRCQREAANGSEAKISEIAARLSGGFQSINTDCHDDTEMLNVRAKSSFYLSVFAPISSPITCPPPLPLAGLPSLLIVPALWRQSGPNATQSKGGVALQFAVKVEYGGGYSGGSGGAAGEARAGTYESHSLTTAGQKMICHRGTIRAGECVEMMRELLLLLLLLLGEQTTARPLGASRARQRESYGPIVGTDPAIPE